MKFLIDNALSELVAKGLQQAGYDTIHVRSLNLEQALEEGSIVVFEENRIRIRSLPINS